MKYQATTWHIEEILFVPVMPALLFDCPSYRKTLINTGNRKVKVSFSLSFAFFFFAKISYPQNIHEWMGGCDV